MIIMQYILFGFGVVFVIPSTIAYLSIIPMVKESISEKIYAHLEGNTVLFESMERIDSARGMLKLDSLINIEFFTSLVFIMLQAEVFVDNPEAIDDWKFVVPWIVIFLLLFLVLLANFYGGTKSVSRFDFVADSCCFSQLRSPYRCQYRWYFVLRLSAEALKIWIIVGMCVKKSLFFDIPEFESRLNVFVEFLVFLGITVLLSIVTAYYSFKIMNQALNDRRKNQNKEVKAMWRVDQQNFNRNFSINAVNTDGERKIVYERVLSILN